MGSVFVAECAYISQDAQYGLVMRAKSRAKTMKREKTNLSNINQNTAIDEVLKPLEKQEITL